MSSYQWASWFTERQFLWLFDGNEKAPETTSHFSHDGEHVDGYFRGLSLGLNLKYRERVATAMVEKFRQMDGDLTEVDHVVGMTPSGCLLASSVASVIGLWRRKGCAASVIHPQSSFRADFGLSDGPGRDKRVLIVDDSVFPHQELRLMVEAILRKRARPLPYLLIPFDPVDQEELQCGIARFQTVALAAKRLRRWHPDACELCAVGSRVIDMDDKRTSADRWHALHAFSVAS
jgi:orotate phosphoribosyltransferase-like protein